MKIQEKISLVLVMIGVLSVTGNSQNVGIGTNNPQYKLDVLGDAHVQGPVTIGDTTGSNYYTLPNVDGSSGQVLQTDGSGTVTWQSTSGGLSSVNTTARLSGDGTSGNPLDLAQQSANTGDHMEWNGSAWSPASPTSKDTIPQGTIVMWSGPISNIPNGWALCDGNNGTPDLTSRFIKSVPGSGTNPGGTGGSNNVSHSHTVPRIDVGVEGDNLTDDWSSSGEVAMCGNTISFHPPNVGSACNSNGVIQWEGTITNTGSGGAYGHEFRTFQGNTNSTSVNNEPAYYQLAFIMKQ